MLCYWVSSKRFFTEAKLRAHYNTELNKMFRLPTYQILRCLLINSRISYYKTKDKCLYRSVSEIKIYSSAESPLVYFNTTIADTNQVIM